MDSNPNNSRLGLQFGQYSEGTEKASFRKTINFGKTAANLQIEKLKSLVGAEDPNQSIILLLTPAPGMSVQLEELIKNLLSGNKKGRFAGDISSAFSEGIVSYNLIQSGSKLVVQIKPGPNTAPMVSQMMQMALGFGIGEVASTEQATVNINALSGIDFYDLLTLHEQGFTTGSALFKSFLFEVILKTVPGSQLDKKLLSILKMFIPVFSQTPLPLLELMQQVDLDFSFRSTEELPPQVREAFIDDPDLKYFPRVPKDLKQSEECKLFEEFVPLLGSNFEVFVTVEDLAAAHIDVNLPGFGTALTSPKDESLKPF
mmetsp:Transcript_63714/g.74088  ORF Transcript_63714/g.74088 Transcript_63714/m.74088 type:complete len:315 (-) Transcript_63714:148-1092(-)